MIRRFGAGGVLVVLAIGWLFVRTRTSTTDASGLMVNPQLDQTSARWTRLGQSARMRRPGLRA